MGYSRVFYICRNLAALNGDPLSDIILCGNPCCEKIISSTEILHLADVDIRFRQRDSVNISLLPLTCILILAADLENQCDLCAMGMVE